MLKNIVISQYPITDSTRAVITAKIGAKAKFLVVSHFAHAGYIDLFWQLRGMQCEKLFLYSASAENQITLPILGLLARLIRSEIRYTIDDTGQAEPWSRSHIFKSGMLMSWSFISGLISILMSSIYLKILSRKGLIQPSITDALEAKRILYIRPALWQGLKAGGAISHGRGVIQSFIEAGYFVDCVADSEFIKLSKNEGRFWNLHPDRAYILPRELNYFNFQSKFVRMTRQFIGEKFCGVIYQRLAIGSVAGVLLSRFWRVPLIIEYNGSEVWLANNWGSPFFFEKIVGLVELEILSHAHLIVAVSEPLKNDLVSRGVSADRIAVCPNGVDLDRFGGDVSSQNEVLAGRKTLGFGPDDIVFTFVGTFGAWHGARLLADAIIDILDEFEARKPSESLNIRFLFIGNGVEFDSVARRLRAPIRDGHVVMMGLVEQKSVPALLSLSDVCLAPTIVNQDGSEFFGSPTKLFEYLAAGKPVIASAVGQVNDVLSGSPIISGKNDAPNLNIAKLTKDKAVGILVEAGNVNTLTSAILSLARNEQARILMSKNARRRAVEQHSWLAHVKKIIDGLVAVEAISSTQTVRVLVNALHAKSGGGVTYIRNVIPHLAMDTALDIHVILQDSQISLFDEVLSGITVHSVRDQNNFREMILTEQFSLPALAKKIDADVIFSTANYGPLIPSNTVILLRNSLEVASVERRLGKLVYWFALMAATYVSIVRAREVIAVSVYARNASIAEMLKRLRANVSIIPHGISDGFREIENIDNPEKFVLTVSDIYVQKNLQTLVRGFASLLRDFPDLTLKVAGKPLDSDYYNQILMLIEELNISRSVEFLGHVESDNLMTLYETCSVFVFPSTVETFGNPLVEAMACGCPIVCSNAAAMPEVAGDSVVYINPMHPEEITDAILDFLKNKKLRNQFRKRAKKQAMKFSWALSARKTKKILIRAAENSNA